MMEDTEPCIKPTACTLSDVGVIWKSAVDRYETVTGVQIKQLARANNVEQILDDISDKEERFKVHRHDGTKLDKFRTLVSQSLSPIQSIGEIVAQATKTVYPPSEAIFAAVRYLISASNRVSADYDKVAGFFEDLRSYLSRLKILEDNVPPIFELRLVLTEVFTSVLVLCAICTKYIQTKRIVKAFRALISGEDAELKDAYDTFHKMVEREQGVVMNAILLGVEQTKTETHAVHASMRENLVLADRIDRNVQSAMGESSRLNRYFENRDTVQERENIVTWISMLDFRDKQRSVFSKHHQGTCHWFLDSLPFQKWFKGDQNSTIWCPGIPGSGKTVMMSTAVSYIEDHSEASNIAMAFIYCDYKDRKTLSETDIWSSITRQLVEACHPMPPEVKAFRDKYIEKRSLPSAEERVALVKAVSQLFDRTYILIDALDECPEENREAFLLLAKKAERSVRLLITSRPNLVLEEAGFTNLVQIKISAHNSDVENYVNSVLRTNKRMRSFIEKDPGLKEAVVRKLLKKAEGMFLLAHLQLKRLCQLQDVRAVRQSLDTLTGDVIEFYKEALKRIEDQNDDDQELARKALSFVFHAKRPLSLMELLHALSVEPEDTALDDMALTEKHILLSITAGLIQVDGSDDVGLVHFTLHEFLEKHQDTFLETELGFALTCLMYLSFDTFGTGPCAIEEHLDQRLRRYVFLAYASLNWGYHLSTRIEQEAINLTLNFLGDERKLASQLQILHIPRHRTDEWYDCFPGRFTPLHAVCYWGLGVVFPIVCEASKDINSQDSHGMTALHLSSQRGHVLTVRLLLEKGAETDVGNNRGETPLAWAARNGHGSILELLLTSGADPMIEDDEGWIALHWAVIGGHTDVVKVLLGHYTSLSSDHNQKHKALILAAEAGSAETTLMLLKDGADVDVKDEEGSTALHWAVAEGHEETTSTLLNNGADPNSKDNYDNSPLHWAIPYEGITRLLLKYGSLPNSQNGTEQTPLHWSVQAGQKGVAEALLQYGADITAQDRYGVTALHAAALQGHTAVVDLLLKSGANVDLLDEDGWTPLHAALVRQHDSLVSLLTGKVENGQVILDQVRSSLKNENERALMEEMAEKKACGSTVVSGLRSAVNSGYEQRVAALLENGVDIDAEDQIGGSTALTLAAGLRRENIVQLLLENGADVNKRERNGRMALHIAAENGYPEIVALLAENGAEVDAKVHMWTPMLLAAKESRFRIPVDLIERGANVNAEDYYGRRALHWAAKHNWKSLARLLLEEGAEIDARDHSGRTAYQWAIEHRQHAVAELLQQFRAQN